MKIYLKNQETNEIISEYTNVIAWGADFVEYNDNGRAKFYCNPKTEYFTDVGGEE